MKPSEFLRVLRQRWRIVAVAVLTAVTAAALASLLQKPVYTAQLTLYASTSGNGDADSAASNSELAKNRVKSYVELVGSRSVSDAVIRRLNLPETPEQLASKMTADTPLDSVILDVEVRDESPQRAADIANAVGESFSLLADDLDQGTTVSGEPAVRVRAVQPAAVPAEPSSPGLGIVLLLGLFGGIVVGVGAALARNALDPIIRSPARLNAVTGIANLTVIGSEAQVREHPLILSGSTSQSRTEAFRRLRFALQSADAERHPRVVVVTSAVELEGRTTTVANLAIAMAAVGNRVLLVDGDPERPQIADMLGLRPGIGLTNLVRGEVKVDQVVQTWHPGRLDVLPSGTRIPSPGELLASKSMGALLADLRQNYDLVVVDAPPLGATIDAAALAAHADATILVCRFKASRSRVESALATLRAANATVAGTVFTMVPPSQLPLSSRMDSAPVDASVPVKGTTDLTYPPASSAATEARPSTSLARDDATNRSHPSADDRPVTEPSSPLVRIGSNSLGAECSDNPPSPPRASQ